MQAQQLQFVSLVKDVKNNNSGWVLLVEDSDSDAEIIKEAIPSDWHVVHTRNGYEALDFLKRHKNNWPKIVLVDLNMPEMDGKSFLTAMDKLPVPPNMPVVIVTTSSQEKNILCKHGLFLGAYVIKGVDADGLVKALQCVIETLFHSKKLNPQIKEIRYGHN